MLNALRKNSAGWIAKIFIGLLVLSFAVWGIQDIFTERQNTELATIGDIKINPVDYQRIYPTIVREWSERLGRPINREQIQILGIHDQIINRLITGAAIDNHTQLLGLGIGDDSIIQSITKDKQFQDNEGNFNKDILLAALRQEQLTEKSYINLQKKAAVRTQLTNPLDVKSPLPKILIDAVNHHRHDKRKISYFTLPESVVGSLNEPTDEELKNYYQKSKNAYQAPEYRKLALLELSVEDVKKTIIVDEAQVKQTYEKSKQRYIKPERRTLEQMTFDSLNKAKQAYDDLKAGKDQKEVAKTHSNGGEISALGDLTKKQMADKTVAEKAFEQKLNEWSEPVEGKFSTVIIRATKITPRVEEKYDDIKKDIEDSLKQRKAQHEILDLYEKIEDERAGGGKLDEIAKKLQLTHRIISSIDRTGKTSDSTTVSDIPSEPKFLNDVFKADIGEDSLPIKKRDGSYVWYDVLDIISPRQRVYEEVKDRVKSAWRSSAKRRKLTKIADDLVKQLKDDKPIAEVAAIHKLEIKTSDFLARGASNDDLPPSLINRSFSLTKNDVSSDLATNNNDWIIYQIVDIQGAKAPDEAARNNFNKEFSSQIANDMVSQYIEGVQNFFGVKRNKYAIDQLTATY